MIWIASFPRSGNTFTRVVLEECYGLHSSRYREGEGDPGWEDAPFVKTHLLPRQLPAGAAQASIYLVRDGRDCVISLAHQRREITVPGSDWEQNLAEAVEAAEGSFFGGWSQHVREWLPVADFVWRFEELIRDPLAHTEQLRAVIDLPEPARDRLPTFDDLRTRTFSYPRKRNMDPDQHRKSFFRRGKVGGWLDEMPERHLRRFWELHGDQLQRLGYSRLAPDRRPGVGAGEGPAVLIEADKLAHPHQDGGRRYVQELLKGVLQASVRSDVDGVFDVLLRGRVVTLESLREHLLLANGEGPLPEPATDSSSRAAEIGWRARVNRWLPGPVRLAIWHGKRLLRALAPPRLPHGRPYDVVHLTLPAHFDQLPQTEGLLVTVHDLLYLQCPQWVTPHNASAHARGMTRALAAGARFIAVSQATREALAEHLGVEASAVRVSGEGCDLERFAPPEPERLEETLRVLGLERPYLLSLSTLEPRKRLDRLIEGYRRYRQQGGELELVVAGRTGWMVDGLEEAVTATEGARQLGFVEERDLPALYAGAHALCYVSEHEGYGLPAAEAIACGTPVVHCGAGALPEIVGDAGIALPEASPEAIAAALEQLAQLSPEAHAGLRQRALDRRGALDWAPSIEAALELYGVLRPAPALRGARQR